MYMNPRTACALIISLSLISFAGCTAPPAPADEPLDGTDGNDVADDEVQPTGVKGGAGQGGGSVQNSAPEVESFSATPTQGLNDGSYVATFSGTLRDRNGDADLSTLLLASSRPATLTFQRPLGSAELTDRAKPATGADGWAAWNIEGDTDGRVGFEFTHTFANLAQTGTYVFTLTVTDRQGATVVSHVIQLVVNAFSEVEVSGDPILADGTSDAGAGWGAWEAQAGATNVESSNFIRLTNTGNKLDIGILIDFNEASFAGQRDADFSFGLNGNIQFAWWEDTSPNVTTPAEGTYTYGATSSTGSVNVKFSGLGNIIYLKYRIVEIGDDDSILPIQSYGASYTVTEL